MPPPANVELGPLTRTVLNGAVWREDSRFPAWQEWADETEQMLSFLVAQGQFERFLPRLRAREREGAFAEKRFAYFLHCNRFRILQWEPEAVPGRPGDLEIQWRDTEPIFVEVKGPGWEGELSAEERAQGRIVRGKNVDMEVRAVDSIGPVLYAIDKCLPKFSNDRRNLVAVVDDLFISPTGVPPGWLEASVETHLASPDHRRVGGVFLMRPEMYGEPVAYLRRFVLNKNASMPLPEPVVQGWIKGNSDRQGPRWAPE